MTTSQTAVLSNGTISGELALYFGGSSSSSVSITNTAGGLIRGDLNGDGTGFAIGRGADTQYSTNLMTIQVTNDGSIIGNNQFAGGDDTFDGRKGNVTGYVDGGDGDDVLFGGAGDNLLVGGAGDDTLRGTQGADELRGGGDVLAGGGGFDTLLGGGGADVLDGRSGRDFQDGGLGRDTLTGGQGRDTFAFRVDAGRDTIIDFEDGRDLIDVSAFGLTGFAALSITTSGADALIDWSAVGGSGVLTIEGAAGQLDASDFIF